MAIWRKPGSQTFRYTGTGNIDAASTFSLVVEETTFNVTMTGIADSRAMMQAAVTQINNAGLGVTASLSTSRATSDGLGIETPTAIAAKANSTDIEITTNTASGTAVTIIEETQLLPAGTTLNSLGFDADTDFIRTSPCMVRQLLIMEMARLICGLQLTIQSQICHKPVTDRDD